MRRIDELHLQFPFYGSRKMAEALRREGQSVNRKQIQRLMRLMNLESLAPKPNTSRPAPEHPRYPYLLRNVKIYRVNQVWCTDVTYIPMACGFGYLVAIMDWFSRFVIAWQLSNTLDGAFCLEALRHGQPEIFNTDQGVQFTAHPFTQELEAASIRISMDGRGRVFDNIFVERLWRTVKYEDIYIKEYATVPDLFAGLSDYFDLYNYQRPHQSLGYCTPADVHFAVNVPIMGPGLVS